MGKHELLFGTRKILAINFSQFWHIDRKRLPISGLYFAFIAGKVMKVEAVDKAIASSYIAGRN